MSEKIESNNNTDYLIIDNRSRLEYLISHIKGAILIPFDAISNNIENYVTNKNVKLILYCRSGQRSYFAQQTLLHMGYKDVENYGGIAQAKERLKSENLI